MVNIRLNPQTKPNPSPNPNPKPVLSNHNAQLTTIKVIFSKRSLDSFFFPLKKKNENTVTTYLPFDVCSCKVETNLVLKNCSFFMCFLKWSFILEEKEKVSLIFEYGGAVPHATSVQIVWIWGLRGVTQLCDPLLSHYRLWSLPLAGQRDLEPSLPIRGGPY